MKFTRRNFVKISGLAAFAGLALPNFAFGQVLGNDVLASQTAESFRAFVGTEFYISGENLSMPAVLTEVRDFPTETKAGECFSLVFEIRARKAQQATYNVFHPAVGNFELFMTTGKSEKRGALVAVINRIIST